jgi:predicted RNA-binding protein associated with RNAse of E/G family
VRVSEIKRHLDGRIERFECLLLLRRPHVAVLRFDQKVAREADGFAFPAGSRSYGFFWRRRPYLLYRMVDPAGRLIAHRFDAVEDMGLREGEISYTDLLLDIWIDALGNARVEDEGEVADCLRRGLLSLGQHQRIEHTRALLLRRHAVILREAERLLRQARVEGPT